MQCPTHGAFCGICHPPHNVYWQAYFICGRRFYSPNPPPTPVVSCDSWCIPAQEKRTNTISQPAVRFPKHPASLDRRRYFCFPSRGLVLFMDDNIPRRAHTHTQYDWMSQNKRDGRITKTRSADKTHGVVIITHVRYISPTLAYMYKFSSF